METRANYVLIGAFTLAAVVGAFLFIMWIAGYGTAGGHRSYQVVFNGSVSGLSNGANVLFNGIKVGEVTHLTFSRSDPHQVVADIDVSSEAPIDNNTKARLESQGITGAAAVALLGGPSAGSALVGENGRPAVIYAERSTQLQDILDNVAALSIRATSVLDDADKILADTSEPIHSAIANVDQFSKALADNAPGVDAALKSVGEIGKQIGPLAARLQTLSDDADRLVQSIDTDQVRTIVDNVQNLSAKGVSVVDRADKLLADNSGSVHSTLENAGVFAKALADNAPNVDVTLKNLAEISKTAQPVVAQIQSLTQNADRVLGAVDPDKVRSIVDNVQGLSAKGNSVADRADKLLAGNSDSIHSTLQSADVFAKALADNAPNVDVTLKNLAEISKTAQPVVAQIQSLTQNADRVLGAVDPDKVRSIVDNVQGLSAKGNSVADRADKLLAGNSDSIHSTLQSADVFAKALAANAPNVDVTLKNLAEISKTVQPVVAQIQTLSQSADRAFKAVDPDKVRSIVDNVQSLSAKGNSVADRADKLLAGNSDSIHSTLQSADVFAKALAANAPNVDVTLKNLAEISKTVQPVVAQIQTLSQSADRAFKAVDPDKVRSIVDSVQSLSAKSNSVADRADKLLAGNSDSIHSTLQSADVFAKALAANAPNVDVTLKNLAAISKTVQPVVAQIQTLSQSADRVVEAVDPDKVRALVDNARTFSQALSESSDNVKVLVRDGAQLATRLNDSAKRLDTALVDVDQLMKAVDSKKVAGIVDSADEVVQTVHQNRGAIDLTLKNFGELSAKLNQSADKVDGVLTSAQGFLGSPGTKGAMDRLSEAALSVKKLADDVDSRVKDIAGGLARFTNTGLREYEALAVEGRRTVQDIDRVVRSLGQNPSQVIFGSRPSLPEYHGGQ